MSDTAPTDASGRKLQDQVVHEIDGIQEYDNNLPNWWLMTLFGSIVFAAAYWFYYDIFEAGEPPPRAFRREMAEIAARQGKDVVMTESALLDLAHDPAVVAEGAKLFATSCSACHGPNGGGTVGPNLTDDFWIHGGTAEQIHHSISEGYPAKGMPAWGTALGAKRIPALTAYVLGMRGTNAAGGKAPQGDKVATP